MIQSKEEVIRKMSLQGDDQARRVMEIKDKQINDLKRELEESNRQMYQYKA